MKKSMIVMLLCVLTSTLFTQTEKTLKSTSKSNNSDYDIYRINGSTVTDIDGNIYHTVTIGTQTWMIENLNTSHYRNSDIIPHVVIDSLWSGLSTGAWCNYNNDTAIGSKYGKLYNYLAVGDNRNIAPIGWHVSTIEDWVILEDYLKVDSLIYAKNKSIHNNTSVLVKMLAATTNWTSSSYKGTIGNRLDFNNFSCFNALPGGYRHGDGPFKAITKSANWWCFSEAESQFAVGRSLFYNQGKLSMSFGLKGRGLSVRCVKD